MCVCVCTCVYISVCVCVSVTHGDVQQGLGLLLEHALSAEGHVLDLATLGKQQAGTRGQGAHVRARGGADRGRGHALVNTCGTEGERGHVGSKVRVPEAQLVEQVVEQHQGHGFDIYETFLSVLRCTVSRY